MKLKRHKVCENPNYRRPYTEPWRIALAITFGIATLAVALWSGYRICDLGWQWNNVRSWIATSAKIESLKMHTHFDDEVLIYQIVCRYSYSFDGNQFIGSRVGLFDAPDNIGTWHNDLFAELQQSMQNSYPVSCFVNPSRPAEALLNRDLRVENVIFFLLFFIVFGSFSFLLLYGPIYNYLRRSRHPERDWREYQWILPAFVAFLSISMGYLIVPRAISEHAWKEVAIVTFMVLIAGGQACYFWIRRKTPLIVRKIATTSDEKRHLQKK